MPDNSDQSSLSNLHDLVLPEPVSWSPLAPGWYVLGAVVVSAAVLLIVKVLRSYQSNRYRRIARQELHNMQAPTPAALAELVKRTALAAYPRELVAGLSGAAWLQFLDASSGLTSFTQGAGRQLVEQCYARPAPATPELIQAVSAWIHRHRREAAGC
jgi:hypothetical protein